MDEEAARKAMVAAACGGGDVTTALALLLREAGPYSGEMCQQGHPAAGICRNVTGQAVPAWTQVMVAEIGDMAPSTTAAPVRVPFDGGGGLICSWFGDAISFDVGAFAADDVINRSIKVQVSVNGREDLITNGSQAVFTPLTDFKHGWLPLLRPVGNRDQLVVTAQNIQPAGGSTIQATIRFGLLSIADLFAAVARLEG